MACPVEEALLRRVNDLTVELAGALTRLQERLDTADHLCADGQTTAEFYRDEIIPAMESLRTAADALEVSVAKDVWPLPSYGDILFSVR